MPGVVSAFGMLRGDGTGLGTVVGSPAQGGVGSGRGSHLQFSTRYCTTLSSTFSMSAVRAHMCFKAGRLRAGAFPLAEPCLCWVSWLPAKGFLQRGGGLQEWEGLGVSLIADWWHWEWSLELQDKNPED